MPESLHAFLDTTVFDGELYDFGSRRFETLRKLIRDQLARIVITDVTKREVEAHIREHVAEALRAVRAVMKERFNRVLNHFGEHFRVFQDRHDASAVNAGRIVQRPSGLGSAIESCSAQPCSSPWWENRRFDSAVTQRERGTRSVCRDGDVDGSPSPGADPGDHEAGRV